MPNPTGQNTGAWMSVCGTTVSGTVFSATGFWDLLCARYNVPPLNLQSHCNICGTNFKANLTLSCSKGGLVIARHNEVSYELLYLAWRDFTPSSVHSEPPIYQSHNRSRRNIRQEIDKKKKGRRDDPRFMGSTDWRHH